MLELLLNWRALERGALVYGQVVRLVGLYDVLWLLLGGFDDRAHAQLAVEYSRIQRMRAAGTPGRIRL